LEKNQVLIFNWIFDLAAHSEMPRNWHVDLIQVLVGSDPDAACLAMGRHIRTGMEEIQDRINARFANSLGGVSGRANSTNGDELLVSNHWRERYARSNASG